MKSIKEIFTTPGDIGFSIIYSTLITFIVTRFVIEENATQISLGIFMAWLSAVSVQYNLGTIIKYIHENGSLSGFKEAKEMEKFVSYVWVFIFIVLFTLLHFFSPDTRPGLSIPIGLATGTIITTTGVTIMFKSLPWRWKP